jgi:hypothetical protein
MAEVVGVPGPVRARGFAHRRFRLRRGPGALVEVAGQPGRPFAQLQARLRHRIHQSLEKVGHPVRFSEFAQRIGRDQQGPCAERIVAEILPGVQQRRRGRPRVAARTPRHGFLPVVRPFCRALHLPRQLGEHEGFSDEIRLDRRDRQFTPIRGERLCEQPLDGAGPAG